MVSLTLDGMQDEVNEWQRKTFPEATPKTIAAHLLREAKELYAQPEDWEEVADIQILLFGMADSLGIDLYRIVKAKLEINKLRQWGQPDEQGVIEHIREK